MSQVRPTLGLVVDLPVPVVTLHVWGVAHRHVPIAVLRMGTHRWALRAQPGLLFAKLLGTGRGETFSARDADPRHWAVLAVWDSPAAAEAFERCRPVRAWDAMATERLRLVMRPLASRGRWSGRDPFGDPGSAPLPWDGPVASLTRARVRLGHSRRFWSAVPPVSADVARAPGLRLALGIGDAPVSLLGTFSVWDSADAVRAFAYRSPPHRAAVRGSRSGHWYAEELFARFAVLAADGTYRGRPLRLPARAPEAS